MAKEDKRGETFELEVVLHYKHTDGSTGSIIKVKSLKKRNHSKNSQKPQEYHANPANLLEVTNIQTFTQMRIQKVQFMDSSLQQ